MTQLNKDRLRALVDKIRVLFILFKLWKLCRKRGGGDVMAKEFIGFIGEGCDGWIFETETCQYSASVPAALDELLERCTEAGEKYKITIEKLS